MINDWFGNNTDLTKDDFMTKLSKTAEKYLMAYSLRILIRKKAKELNLK